MNYWCDKILLGKKDNMKSTKITIGGLSGTGKGTVAKMIAEKLGFQYNSAGNFFRELAKEKGYESLLEFQKAVQGENSQDYIVDLEVDERTRKYGKENEKFVMEGRLCAHMIPDAFKILLLCEDVERFRRIAQRQNLGLNEAKKETLAREELYTNLYKNFYKIENYLDIKHYDLIIDTTHILPDEIVEKIINELK